MRGARCEGAKCEGAAAIAIASVWLMAQPAFAQDSFRQTVVVTAAATPVELGTVTRRMTVITREQIARLPVQTVADALRLAASVDVRARGSRGVQTDFAVRGANFGQMLVLVDGVRLNDAQSGHHNGDIPVPLDAVERIEVLYGPGSSLFGADAFGGTVNVITRRTVERPSLVGAGRQLRPAPRGRGQVGFERGAVREVARRLGRSVVRVHVRPRLQDGDGALADLARRRFGRVVLAPVEGVRRQQLLRRQRAVARMDQSDARRRRSSLSARPPAGASSAIASYRTHGDRFLFNQRAPAAVGQPASHPCRARARSAVARRVGAADR